MKHNLFAIALIVLFTTCREPNKGKKVISEVYANGKPLTIWYFDDENDADIGVSDTSIGELIAVSKPVNMRQEQFYQNGNLVNEGRYKDGFATGEWKFYFEDGALQARSYYKKGQSSDTVFCYYNSGELSRVIIEIDTEKHYWHSIDYYKNGNKFIETYRYTDSLGYSLFNGPYKEWHPNGQIKKEAELKMGKSVGEWRLWDEKGTLIKISDKEFDFGYQ